MKSVIKKVHNKFYYYLQRYLYPFIDKIYNERLDVSSADLMLLRDEISQIQFLVASRLLDIEEFQNENLSNKFRFQRAINIHHSSVFETYGTDSTSCE